MAEELYRRLTEINEQRGEGLLTASEYVAAVANAVAPMFSR